MEATAEQIEAIKRARRLFSEDRTQQDLSLGTCAALIVLELMELRAAVNRQTDEMRAMREDRP